MGTGRKFSKKPATRPRKGAAQRRRRDKVLKARLVKIGLDPEAVEKMRVTEIRSLISKYGKKTTRGEVEALIKKKAFFPCSRSLQLS